MDKNNQKAEQPERLLNIKELSELTGMKTSTLYLWTETGRIPVIHAGKSLRYRFSEVLQSLESKHERSIPKD